MAVYMGLDLLEVKAVAEVNMPPNPIIALPVRHLFLMSSGKVVLLAQPRPATLVEREA
jgi:hypothetical protein